MAIASEFGKANLSISSIVIAAGCSTTRNVILLSLIHISIRVRNLSAYWLPQITLKQEIGGTVYRVSGSYEGEGLLDRRVRRILAYYIDQGAGQR